jgi:PIN domain nuclease of toxin-antitoxin system
MILKNMSNEMFTRYSYFDMVLDGDNNLSEISKNVIENENNQKFVSIASIWELVIKISLGKFKFDKGFKNFLHLIEENGFEVLPISFKHAITVSTLEFKHRDPFDRLLISQALSDNLAIISKDSFIMEYNVDTIW